MSRCRGGHRGVEMPRGCIGASLASSDRRFPKETVSGVPTGEEKAVEGPAGAWADHPPPFDG